MVHDSRGAAGAWGDGLEHGSPWTVVEREGDEEGEPLLESLSDVERGDGSDLSARIAAREEGASGGDERRPVLSQPSEFEAAALGEEGRASGRKIVGGESNGEDNHKGSSVAAVVSISAEAAAGAAAADAALREEARNRRTDSFGDEEMLTACPGYYTT